jgi:hypothetical protein
MINKLLFIAALLVPGLASAANPSANLSGQIVPNSANPLLGLYQGDGTTPKFSVWAGRLPDYSGNYSFCYPGGVCYINQNNGYPIIAAFEHMGPSGSFTDPIAAANGSYNSAYQQTADMLAAYNQSTGTNCCIYAIRIDSEWTLNGAPYSPWLGQSDQSTPVISTSNWIAGVCNVINIIRGTPGLSNVKIYVDAPMTAADQAYWPEPTCAVDVTGADVYFQSQYDGTTSAQSWTLHSQTVAPFQINFNTLAAWGVTKNHPLVIAEWCDTYTDIATPGNTNLAQFAAWMQTHNVVAQAYWDTDDNISSVGGCALLNNATRKQAYINSFFGTRYTGSSWHLLAIPPSQSWY